MSPEATHFCNLYLTRNLSFSDYKLLSEWLGTYHYAIPSDRYKHTGLSIALLNWYDGDIDAAWHASNITEHFPDYIQLEIFNYILNHPSMLT